MNDARLDEHVRSLLVARKGDWPRIAAQAEVSHSWISQFVRGKIPNPGFATLKRLEAELSATASDTAPDVPAAQGEAA